MTAEQLHDCDSVHGYISRICFKNGPPTRIGAELEFLLSVGDRGGADPRRPVSLARVRAAFLQAPPFPGGSSLTFEPGGQVELSSQPASRLTALVTDLQRDLDHLVHVLSDAGLSVVETAVDPCRPPRRQLNTRRYDAMESYFDALEPGVPVSQRVGRAMMCSTAATQLNLDAGADHAARWHLLHDLGPVMIAAFANSPLHGWKSSRQRIWQHLDPARTAPPTGSDPAEAYTEFALDAPVMLHPGRGRFRDWVLSGDPPTTDDLAEHLTTLFPPVRPRGWFEVRYLDAQPLEWWAVPVAVVSALLDDPLAASEAAEAAAPARGRWESAGRIGLDDPVLHEAARRCFAIALDSLAQRDPLLVGLVDRFTALRIEHRKAVS